MMKDTAWELFRTTGNPAYYMLYRALGEEDGRKHSRHNTDGD